MGQNWSFKKITLTINVYNKKIDLQTHQKVSFFLKINDKNESWYGNWIENNFFIDGDEKKRNEKVYFLNQTITFSILQSFQSARDSEGALNNKIKIEG